MNHAKHIIDHTLRRPNLVKCIFKVQTKSFLFVHYALNIAFFFQYYGISYKLYICMYIYVYTRTKDLA